MNVFLVILILSNSTFQPIEGIGAWTDVENQISISDHNGIIMLNMQELEDYESIYIFSPGFSYYIQEIDLSEINQNENLTLFLYSPINQEGEEYFDINIKIFSNESGVLNIYKITENYNEISYLNKTLNKTIEGIYNINLNLPLGRYKASFIGNNSYQYTPIFADPINYIEEMQLIPVNYEKELICPSFIYYDLRTGEELKNVKTNIGECVETGPYFVSFEKQGYEKRTEELFLTERQIEIYLEKNALLNIYSDSDFKINEKEYFMFNNTKREIKLSDGNYVLSYNNQEIPINIKEGNNTINLTDFKLENEENLIKNDENTLENDQGKVIYIPIIIILCVILYIIIRNRR